MHYWFDASALTAPRKRRALREQFDRFKVGGRLSDAEHDALSAFAARNGFTYASLREDADARVPSMVAANNREAVLWGAGACGPGVDIEFANSGMRFMPGDWSDPNRRGHIAIRHGRTMPTIFVAAKSWNKASPLALGTMALELASVVTFDGGSDPSGSRRSQLDSFRSGATRLEVHEASAGPRARKRDERKVAKEAARVAAAAQVERQGFATLVEKGAEDDVSALLDPAARSLLSELAVSFDVEVRDQWVIALSRFGDVSTPDPEVWAWVFSQASRLLDLVDLWTKGGVRPVGHPAWYTAQRVARPGQK